MIRVSDAHREASLWRSVPDLLMAYIRSMEGFLKPLIPFEDMTGEDDIEDTTGENDIEDTAGEGEPV